MDKKDFLSSKKDQEYRIPLPGDPGFEEIIQKASGKEPKFKEKVKATRPANDTNSRPNLELSIEEGIYVKPKNLEELEELMKICECANGRWYSDSTPLDGLSWWKFDETTVVELGNTPGSEYSFGIGTNSVEFCEETAKEVLDVEQFYEQQKISQGWRKRILSWYDNNE